MAEEDSLSLRDDKDIIQMIYKWGDNFPEVEKIQLPAKIIKINKKEKEQMRILLITNKALYNVKPNNLKTCQRRIDLEKIASITSSLSSLEFAINIPEEYDYRFKAYNNKQKTQIIQSINDSLFKLEQRKLIVHKIQQSSTITHAVTKQVAKLFTQEQRLRRYTELAKLEELNEELNAAKILENKIKSMSHQMRHEIITFGYIRIDIENVYKFYKIFVPNPIYLLIFAYYYVVLGIQDIHTIKFMGKSFFGIALKVEQKCRNSTNKKNEKYFRMNVYRKQALSRDKWIRLKVRETRRYLEGIDHPFIQKLYFAFKTKTRIYIGLQYLDGDAAANLCFLLKKYRRFTEETVCLWVAQITSAIGYLHDKQIFDINLKPEHIAIDRNGNSYLTDIVPRGFGQMNGNYCYKKPNSIGENPEYLPFDKVENGGSYDSVCSITKEVDWWSLGILLYELCIGVTPFYSPNWNEIYRKIRETPLLFPPNVSENFKNLCYYLLKRKIEDRLGYGNNDYLEILQHSWFDKIDMKKLNAKQIKSNLSFDPSPIKYETFTSFTEKCEEIVEIMKDDTAYESNKGYYPNFTFYSG